MHKPLIRKSFAVVALSLMALAGPVAAQIFSGSHEFLKAVRDRDGTVVTQAISEPGSTIVNTRDLATGDTALHIVAERQDTAWIRFLTQNGANPNMANKKGVTPLMIAVSFGHVEGVEALLKAGARIDEANGLGETALITATHRRDLAMVRLLLGKGASADRSDNSGRSARDYAAVMGSKQLEAEFTAADAARKGGAGQSYGPGL